MKSSLVPHSGGSIEIFHDIEIILNYFLFIGLVLGDSLIAGFSCFSSFSTTSSVDSSGLLGNLTFLIVVYGILTVTPSLVFTVTSPFMILNENTVPHTSHHLFSIYAHLGGNFLLSST